MTTTAQKYAGDDSALVLAHGKVVICVKALAGAEKSGLLRPKTVKQVLEALAAVPVLPPTNGDIRGEQASKVIAALIVAEHDLSEQKGNDEFVLGVMSARTREHLEGVQRALRAAGCRLVEKNGYREWVAIDVWVVAFDQTSYWTIPDEYKPWVERAEGVYYFDKNRGMHACSLSPDYELRFVENRAIIKYDCPDDLREKIGEYFADPTQADDEVKCHDVRDMDRKLEANKSGTVYHYGNPGVDWGDADGDEDEDEEKYENIMEAMREGLQANTVL